MITQRSYLLMLALFVIFVTGCDSDFDSGMEQNSLDSIEWKKSYGNDRFAGLTVFGLDGDIYSATALHTYQYGAYVKLFKTSASGVEIWDKEITITLDSYGSVSTSFGSKMRVNAQGEIGIVGTSMGMEKDSGGNIQFISGTHKAFFVKVTENGEKLWQYIYSDTQDESHGKSFDYDSNGNVYFAGIETYESYKKRMFVVKLSPDGEELSVQKFPLTGSSVSQDELMIMDGYLYLAGNSDQRKEGIWTIQDIRVIKATLDGTVLWQKDFTEASFSFQMAGLAYDRDHNIILIATKSNTNPNDPVNTNSAVLKIDPDGNKLWLQTFGTSEMGYSKSIAVDSENNLLISGWTRGAFPGYTNPDERDPFVLKLSSTGSLIKTEQYAAPQGSNANSLLIDGQDHVYVSGFGKLEGESHYSFLIKY
jgi:hypothetical protein